MRKSSNTITNEEARLSALAAQGFKPKKPARAGTKKIRESLDNLAVLQIDAVNALVRAHYLPLFSRLGPYPREELDSLTWGPAAKRAFFEVWGHEASFMPMDLYPLMRWRMKRAAAGQGIYSGLAGFGRDEGKFISKVLKTIETQGAVCSGQLNAQAQRTGPWWGWSREKAALEWLFAAGKVTVSHRKNFERFYDLPQRVFPEHIAASPPVDEAEAHRALMYKAARALGVATEKDLRDYFRLKPAEAGKALAELLENNDLTMIEVENWRQPAYCPADFKPPRGFSAEALLSPFDSLIWERSRTERLFDFKYRLEFYTPAAKRVYGYYVLPFLYGRQLVGRVDLRADRASGRLLVPAVHPEKNLLTLEAQEALAASLTALSRWLGLAQVCFQSSGALEKRLNRIIITKHS